MSPVAVLVVAVLIAAWWWLYGVDPARRCEIGCALVVLVALGLSWPELVPAIVAGAPLGFGAGLATRLWAELADEITRRIR